MWLFNTLTKQKEEFNPRSDKKVGMFVCGPTVYDSPHLGHARTYIAFDILAKWLRHLGYKVKYIQNITDIDDKIINRAKEENKPIKEIVQKFEKEYLDCVKKLGIDSVSKYIRASENIKSIMKQIKTLLEKGCAYKIDDGIYFDISKFSDYGKLSGRTVEQAEDGISRIDQGVNKKNKGDFALWKFSKPGEPVWKTKLGDGRPGWHIEDTAITEKYLGQQYDIHCGGLDLIFPHHEAEIAQQESASEKKPHVLYWLHSGFLMVNGQKMSKSLGNFITVPDVLKYYPAEALRLLFLTTHYRSPIDYKEENLKQSAAAIQRINEFIAKLNEIKNKEENESIDQIIENAEKEFENSMNDDLNTPQAIASIFELIKKINPLIDSGKTNKKSVKKILNFLEETNKILGIIQKYVKQIPKEILKLSELREKFRQEKRFSEADDTRDQITAKGYSIDDTPNGPLIKKT